MTNFDDIITKAGNGTEYTLSDSERARMSRVVREYMSMKPRTRAFPTTSYHYWFSLAHRPVAAALVLVMVFGSSVSYAAEGALPGDTLYAVKTYFNEPAKIALATSAEAKAEVQIELAERRIEEAATLASEGRLDETTADQLAVAFESHAAALAENAKEADEDDDSASTELASRFESRLAAHGDILLEIESEDAEPHATRLAEAIRTATEEALVQSLGTSLAIGTTFEAALTEPLAATAAPVNAPEPPEDSTLTMAMSIATDSALSDIAEPAPHQATPANARAKMESTAQAAAESAPTIDAKKLSRMQSAAEKSLKSARKKLESAKSLSNDARTAMETDLTHAASRIADGKAFLEADSDFDAYLAFKDSFRISEQTGVFIKAAPVLEKVRSRTKSRLESAVEIELKKETGNDETEILIATSSTGSTDDRGESDASDSEEAENESSDDHGGSRGSETSASSGKSGAVNINLDLSL